MCLIVNFSLIFFFYIYYSTVNENSTNNVPVVGFFFYTFIWMSKGNCLYDPTVFQQWMSHVLPSAIEFDHRTLLYRAFSSLQRSSGDLHLPPARLCEWAVAQWGQINDGRALSQLLDAE